MSCLRFQAGLIIGDLTRERGYLIVEPVKRDGSTDGAIINASEKSGVTTSHSDGLACRL